MLQMYSTNISVAANESFPLNVVALQKGVTALPSGAAAIQLTRCGVYMVSVDVYGTAGAQGELTIQLQRNGLALPQAIASTSAAAADVAAASFQTLIQVHENDTACCCTSPTILQILNQGVALTDAHINVCVTKIC